MKKKDNNPLLSYFDVFKEYKEHESSQDLITFDEMISTVLFNNNLGFNSPIYLGFISKIDLAFKNKYDILLKDFNITFNLNLKFSQEVLVPIITTKNYSANNAIDLTTSSDIKYQEFLNSYNAEIKKLLALKKSIKIFPHVILFHSELKNDLVLLFSEKVVAVVTKEQ
ncbi:DUF2714 domain-containing protein [Metamycoplasma hominis]|uniref:DUF2714 domain-containing protein n=1 Tax=Metamycoplasma hominis TaxID=2098 RepID=UPI0034A2A9C3